MSQERKDFIAITHPLPDASREGPDYSVARKHIELLSKLAAVSNSGISVFDTHLGKHIFTSCNFTELFGYDMEELARGNTDYFNRHIHPDDLPLLDRNGQAVMRRFEDETLIGEIANTKMINEYRLLIGGKILRVIEQYQALEILTDGRVWLSLSVLDVSPNQDPAQTVKSKLINTRTGEVYNLPEFNGDANRAVLSEREKTILKMVGDGLFSKEISEQLTISVHTVNTHRQRILEKLNVDNSLEAVKYAARYGLLD